MITLCSFHMDDNNNENQNQQAVPETAPGEQTPVITKNGNSLICKLKTTEQVRFINHSVNLFFSL